MDTNITVDSLLQKIDNLGRLVEKQVLMLAGQSALIERLKAKIVDLEKRVKKNSGNSSRPPKSSLRENGKNKSGGQLDCVFETLKQTDTPDIIKKHALITCPDCNQSLIMMLCVIYA